VVNAREIVRADAEGGSWGFGRGGISSTIIGRVSLSCENVL
jgi:hypothetical protein